MPRIGLDFQTMRMMFFDRAKIKNTIDARTRKVLSKFGAHVRQTSKQSIRKRKGTSKPGRPPYSHSGLLKKFIFFGYDAMKRSVVIGPVVVSGKSGKAPPALEHGGQRTGVASRLPPGRSATVGEKIQPRPFMGPAFQREISNLPNIWFGIIK